MCCYGFVFLGFPILRSFFVFFELLGPSGCGKTSFLNVLTGKATYGEMTGSLEINGTKVSNTNDPDPGEISISKFSYEIGFVPQGLKIEKGE